VPFTATYDPALRILCVTVEGAVSPDTLDAALATITSAKEYPPNVDTIWVFRDANFAVVHAEEMRNMRDVRKRYSNREGSFTALVVTDDVAFGMSRMFQALSDGVVTAQHLLVTRSLADARQWIAESRASRAP